MGKFKDRLDSLEGGENPIECEPGRTINFKTKAPVPTPPGVTPPGVTPPTEVVPEGEPAADKICECVTGKFDELIDDVRNTYPYGTSFNTGRLFTQAYTPIEIDPGITQPSPNTAIIGFYDSIPVAPKRNNENARQIWVIADPDGAVNPADPFLYVRTSKGPNTEYSVEVPVRVGEDWEFRDVYEFRIRSNVKDPITGIEGGQQYRITTDPHHTTFVSTIVNVPTGTTATTPPVANRPNFIARNMAVGTTDATILTILGATITIPNGFALVVRANIDNLITSRIFVSRTNALSGGDRNTLAPGEKALLYITNTDMVHVASNVAGQAVDLLVEQ